VVRTSCHAHDVVLLSGSHIVCLLEKLFVIHLIEIFSAFMAFGHSSHLVHKGGSQDPLLSLLNPLRNFRSYFSTVNLPSKSLDSSVGIALGYGLDDRGSRVPFSEGA
jgi:hypothetical protein